MKMKTKVVAAFGTVLAGAFLIPLISCENQNSRSDFSKSKGYASDSLLSRILSNDIVFYGQVLDFDGNPAPHAKVTYASLNSGNFDSVWTGGGPPDKVMHTDEFGRFEIHEVGGSLYVNCSHPDYYGNDDPKEGSTRKFGYGFQVGNGPACDPQNPAIFRLLKKGTREPLYFSNGYILNRNLKKGYEWRIKLSSGEGISIDLARSVLGERETSVHIAHKTDREGAEKKDYAWGWTLCIPGGGFIEKQMDFDFIAPEDGYVQEIEIGCSRDSENWKDRKVRYYFIKFPNGLHGIFEVEMTARGSFCFQALINPDPSSRNLEYTYEKQINKYQDGQRYRRFL